MRAGSEPSPHLALLEAVSASSAHLSYLSLALTLQVEKLVTAPGPAERSQERSRDGASSLQAFKDRAVKVVLARRQQVEQARDQGAAGLLAGLSRLVSLLCDPVAPCSGVS